MRATIKKILRTSSALRRIYYGSTDFFSIAKAISPFVPNSVGSYRNKVNLGLACARNTPTLLAQLCERTSEQAPIAPIESFCSDHETTAAGNELKELFDRYGSDKSTLHDYHHLYAHVLRDIRNKPINLLEVGLGTNDTSIVSTMGKRARPGASTYAFRDFLPKAQIFGADVDKTILFEGDRIKTGYVDQTAPKTFDDLAAALKIETLDVLIDDGLHSPDANLNTLNFGLDHVKKGGWLIIEDIGEATVPIWSIVYSILSPKYPCWLVEAKHGFLFVLRRT